MKKEGAQESKSTREQESKRAREQKSKRAEESKRAREQDRVLEMSFRDVVSNKGG